MSNDTKQAPDANLIKTLGSLQFGLVLLIAVAVVSIVGTVLPQSESQEFYREHFSGPILLLINIFRFDITYRSPLFIGLLCLVGVNLLFCSLAKFPSTLKRAFSPDMTPDERVITAKPVKATAKGATLDTVNDAFSKAGFKLRKVGEKHLFGQKGRLGYLGATTVHVSLVLMLLGGVVSLLSGVRAYIQLYEGESTDVAWISDNESIPLGFDIKLDDFSVSYYEEFENRPKDYLSKVTVSLPDVASFTKDIRVNKPLMLNHLTVYQSSFGRAGNAMPVSSASDTVLVQVRPKGAPSTMPPLVEKSMTAGETLAIPGFGDSLSVRLAEIHRNFRGEQGQQGIKLDVLSGGVAKWNVFAFKSFPGMNMPAHEDIPLVFDMAELSMEAGSETPATEERYYTVLGVVHDRGIPLMWVGAFLMTAGLFLSFYLRPRRIWAIQQGNDVIIGGTAKGDSGSLDEFVRETLKKI